MDSLKKSKINLHIILPAFNEDKVIGQVLDKLKPIVLGLEDINAEIVVIDDGSQDKTFEIASRRGVVVLRHVINRGLGGALRTGLEYAKRNEADIVVTMDSDGQHSASDIGPMIEPIINGKADIVIGSRLLKENLDIPFLRKIIIKGSNIVTWLFFGIYTTDSQSGFRAFSKKAVNKLKLKTQRMEVSSELFEQIKKHGLKFREVPINVKYTDYSKAKGQSNLNAVKILIKLVLRTAR